MIATSHASFDIHRLIDQKKVLVCCGTGGVGKTTTSVALSLAAASLGKKVLVLTIDPSKRLAQALGISQNPEEPIQIAKQKLQALGINQGELWAWLLEPSVVSDRVVRAQTKGNQADLLLKNTIYQEVSGMVAGMQEYTAVEALYHFISQQSFDLIILDTPPARHALRFLDAPKRVAQFLDKRIFKLFTPSTEGILGKMASKLIDEVLDRAFGEEMRKELKSFFELFGQILDYLNGNQQKMESFFQSDAVAFILVTTESPSVIEEALYFYDQCTHHKSLSFAGILLNKAFEREACTTVEKTVISQALGTKIEESQLNVLSTKLNTLVDQIQTEQRLKQIQVNAVEKQLQALCAVKSLPHLGIQGGELEGILILSKALLD
jgi:anion-transporting  ArsA/GET3 family ATPase